MMNKIYLRCCLCSETFPVKVDSNQLLCVHPRPSTHVIQSTAFLISHTNWHDKTFQADARFKRNTGL